VKAQRDSSLLLIQSKLRPLISDAHAFNAQCRHVSHSTNAVHCTRKHLGMCDKLNPAITHHALQQPKKHNNYL